MSINSVNQPLRASDLLQQYYVLLPSTEVEEQKQLEQVIRSLDPLIRSVLREAGYGIEELVSLAHERLISAIRKSHAEQAPIENISAFTRTLVTNLIIDEERKNSPRRKMICQIRYVVTYPKYQAHLAQWPYALLTMIGLRAWVGRHFKDTDNYLLFCRDQDVFVVHCLRVLAATREGSKIVHLRDARFHEVVIVFFKWIETPLEQWQMVDDFLKILPINAPILVSLDNKDEFDGQDAYELIAQPTERSTEIDWAAIWNCIQEFSLDTRRVFVLGMDAEMLRHLTVRLNPIPVIAVALQYAEETLERYVGNGVPLQDAEIAKILGTSVNNVQVMRNRGRERMKRRFPHLPMLY